MKKENKDVYYQPDLFDMPSPVKTEEAVEDHSDMLCCGHRVPYMGHCPSCGTRND